MGAGLENQVHTYNGMAGTGRVGNVKQVLKPENTVETQRLTATPKHCSGSVSNFRIFSLNRKLKTVVHLAVATRKPIIGEI